MENAPALARHFAEASDIVHRCTVVILVRASGYFHDISITMDTDTPENWQERALDRFEILRADAGSAAGAYRAIVDQINDAARARREAEGAVAEAERPPVGTPVAVADRAREDAAHALERAKAALRRAVGRRDAAQAERHALVGRAQAAAGVLVTLGLITEQEAAL